MKALITGINGFAGSFLAEKLLENSANVYGTLQPGTGLSNIKHFQDKVSCFELNLLDAYGVNEMMRSVGPDLIFHLAGISNVKLSWDDPQLTFRTNVTGTQLLLDSALRNASGCRILFVSSAEVYGSSAVSEKAADETFSLMPQNPYAESKAAADELARRYAKEKCLDVIVARPGNHIGPRQAETFFVPAVAKQVAMVMKGKMPPVIALGNIDVYRDFCDVKDIVNAYVLLAEKGEAGEVYNICCGKKRLLRDIAEKLIELSGIEISIAVDPARFRQNDPGQLTVSNEKLKQMTGWRPVIDIEDTLKDVLNYWLDRV